MRNARIVAALTARGSPSLVPIAAIFTFFTPLGVAARAQGTLPKSAVVPSPVPGSVPSQARPFLRERDALERRATQGIKGTKGNKDGLPRRGEGPDIDAPDLDESPPSGSTGAELGLPGLQAPAANAKGETINNKETSAQANPALLPRLVSAPPSGVAGFLGQTLKLSARPALRDGADAKAAPDVFVAWILKGDLLCVGEECEIPLDGKTLDVGAHTLLVLAYNAHGSAVSRHVVQVVRGNWDPSKPFRADFKKGISPVPVNVEAAPADPALARGYMVRGNAVHAYPDFLQLLGSVPRNVEWNGRFKTASHSVLRVQDPVSGDWFLLPRTDALPLKNRSAPSARSLQVRQGGVRLRAGKGQTLSYEGKPYLQQVSVRTEELTLFPAPNADVSVLRVAPSSVHMEKRKAKKDGEPLTFKEMHATRVVVVSGTVRLDLAKAEEGRPKTVVLPPGVEFIMYENGVVAPLGRPVASRMERLMRMTLTPEEVAERARKKADAASVDLNAHLKKVEALLAEEDYFEALSLLAVVEDRGAEDVRVPYYLGVSNKGLYQVTEAEKFFKRAMAQNGDFALSYWQMGQLKLEDKKYGEARAYFSDAQSRMESADKLYPEGFYYQGVADYNLNSDFFARNAFTQALWNEQLDELLKVSAGSFLKTIASRRRWSVVVPVGVQYEGNGLGVADGDPVAAPFPDKDFTRLLTGLFFTYDSALGREKSGWYWGGGARVTALTNYPRTFKSLDALQAEVNLQQTGLSIEKDPKDQNAPPRISSMRIFQSFVSTFLDQKLYSQTFNLGLGFDRLTVQFGFERDAVGKGVENRDAILGRQSYVLPLGEGADGAWDVTTDLDERYVLTKTDTNGHEFSGLLTPGYSVTLGLRTSARLALIGGARWFLETPRTTEYKAAAIGNLNYFIAPWLLSTASAGYEYTLVKPDDKKVSKPVASLIFTGLF